MPLWNVLFCLFLLTCIVQTVSVSTMDFMSAGKINSFIQYEDWKTFVLQFCFSFLYLYNKVPTQYWKYSKVLHCEIVFQNLQKVLNLAKMYIKYYKFLKFQIQPFFISNFTADDSFANVFLCKYTSSSTSNSMRQVKSVYLCIPTKHRILHQEYRDRKRRP